MADPDILLGIDKTFVADNGLNLGYNGHVNPEPQLPAAIIGGSEVLLVVGDDTKKAEQLNMLNSMTLIVTVSGMELTEGIRVFVNGDEIPQSDISRVNASTFDVVLHAPPVVRGINRFKFLPGPDSLGNRYSSVTNIELTVDYK